ncbi:MAG: hypothetical protein KIT58_07210, partial [Planctomycetota bacterium]|nr:hypothetical protein [Planctomycetota bacterium]
AITCAPLGGLLTELIHWRAALAALALAVGTVLGGLAAWLQGTFAGRAVVGAPGEGYAGLAEALHGLANGDLFALAVAGAALWCVAWVRDLDLARAHEEVDAAVALLDEPGAAARRPGPSPWPVRTYFPATTWAACSTGKLFEDFERTEEARRFTHLALLLRLHCLETGAYPAALGPAPDGADLVYRVVDGGFELSLPGRPDLHLRVTR